MFGLGRKWPRRTAQIAAAGMLVASGSMFFASTALAAPGGNNGAVFINSISFDANGNDPHITCPIVIEWKDFDPADAQFTTKFTPQAPTGGTVTATGDLGPTHFSGGSHKETYSLQFTGAPQHNGEFHVTVQVDTTDAHGSISKSKTVWVTSCGPDLSMDKTGTAGPVNPGDPVSYTLTVTNVGSGQASGTTTVTDSLPAGLDPGTMVYASGAGTWTCNNTTAGTASSTPSCSTTSVLAGGSVTTFTVSSKVSAGTAAGTYTDSATVTTPADANSANNTDTQDTVVPAATVDPSATATATCNTLGAHLDGGTSGATFHIVEPGGAHDEVIAAGATKDVSYAPSAGATITVTIGGVQKAKATASNSCGGPPAAPSASTNADCSALTAHLDGGTNGTTFTITEPGGTHSETVAGGATKDVSYGSGNNATITVNDGATQLDTSSAPSDCVVAGTAAPQVDEANHCKSGMNLTLSNMNGTADTTFTVTDPDGNTQQVGVRAGQLKKLSFAVTEDTTGTLSVSAPGLAKKTFSYKKNCATVLGVKHTRKPPHKTHPKPVVEGEHAQLPFTGFNTQRALLDGAALFFFGAVLCMLGARRKDEDYVY